MARRDIVDIADFGEGNDFDRSTPKRRRYLLCLVLALFINNQPRLRLHGAYGDYPKVT